MIVTVTLVTAIALGAAFAVATAVLVLAGRRNADATLLHVARSEARKVPAQDLSFKLGADPAPSDLGPMIMAAVLYEADGRIRDATWPFEDVQPRLSELDRPDLVPFDFRHQGHHFRGVLTRPEGHADMRMLVASSREEIDADERQYLRVVLAAFVLAVVWAAAVARWRAAALTREQRAIAATVRSFAEGRLDVRVDVRSSDPETAQLASDINDMAARISALVSAQKRFVAHAAHELRSPLARVYGELQLALRKERTREEYRKSIEDAEAATRELKQLADDLLALARAPGADDHPVTDVEVGRLADEALALMPEPDARRVDKEGASCVVRGRPDDLVRLLRNLLENAVAHSPPQGRVRVEWAERDGSVEVRVSDEGAGVPEGLRDRIFEPFFRADRTKSGTGLGLGIAREIARAHGGDVVVRERSAGDGAGATFIASLPAAREAAGGAGGEDGRARRRSHGREDQAQKRPSAS